jgi:hypothetical protein
MLGLIAGFFMLAADTTPQMEFHFGAGVAWAHVPGEQYCCSRPTQPSYPDGLGISIDGQLDYGRFFVAGSLAFAESGPYGWAPAFSWKVESQGGGPRRTAEPWRMCQFCSPCSAI